MKKNSKKNIILVAGNEAMGMAAIASGCSFYAGYPITPQNELIGFMAREMDKAGRAFVQAESEVAAINMVFGASATGARAMTSSSSPGISLKQEGISYLAGAQLPCVVINVMRAGPGLGGISSSQGDYFQSTRGGGHGDYFTPCFSPASVKEAAELVMLAFDLADYYRTPVLILADAIIGQMMEPLQMPKKSNFKKKIKNKAWALTGARNRLSNTVHSFFLNEELLEEHNRKLAEKWDQIKKSEQRSESYKTQDAKYLIVSYGSQARISKEAVDLLRRKNIKVGLFRPISLWPYPADALKDVSKKVKKILVVEQSLGQMVEDVRLSVSDKEVFFFGRAGGGIPQVVETVEAFEKKVLKR